MGIYPNPYVDTISADDPLTATTTGGTTWEPPEIVVEYVNGVCLDCDDLVDVERHRSKTGWYLTPPGLPPDKCRECEGPNVSADPFIVALWRNLRDAKRAIYTRLSHR